jgi:hypothetical protein
MLDRRRWLRLAAGSTAGIALAALAQPGKGPGREFIAATPSRQARELVEWALRSGDTHGRPFAVVDKREAHIYVFHGDGRLAGHSPALLGSTRGDHTVPGVGLRAQTGDVGPDERTTPAGRFDAVPGRNANGVHVVWVDYESAFDFHRLRPGFSYGRRASRLAAGGAADMRVSWGCVVVPVPFYRGVVERVLGQARSVVYVLPEKSTLQAVFRKFG